jgi:hypothetical protein
MVDWWQALLLVLAGGIAGLPTAYAVHFWTTKAGRAAEERQAIRQLRRERMQPVLDFLDTAKQSAARQDVIEILDGEYKRMSPEDSSRLDQWRKMKSELLEVDPDGIQLMRAYHVAEFASISIPGLGRDVFRIHAALIMKSDRNMLRQFGPALRSAEQLLEQYLAGAEPHEAIPDKPSQDT